MTFGKVRVFYNKKAGAGFSFRRVQEAFSVHWKQAADDLAWYFPASPEESFKMVDAAIETGADAILISTIISHNDVHRKNMRKLDELCREKGIRDKVMIMCGGTQVTRDIAKECGMDDGFGRGTKGIHVVNSMVKILKAKKRV